MDQGNAQGESDNLHTAGGGKGSIDGTQWWTLEDISRILKVHPRTIERRAKNPKKYYYLKKNAVSGMWTITDPQILSDALGGDWQQTEYGSAPQSSQPSQPSDSNTVQEPVVDIPPVDNEPFEYSPKEESRPNMAGEGGRPEVQALAGISDDLKMMVTTYRDEIEAFKNKTQELSMEVGELRSDNRHLGTKATTLENEVHELDGAKKQLEKKSSNLIVAVLALVFVLILTIVLSQDELGDLKKNMDDASSRHNLEVQSLQGIHSASLTALKKEGESELRVAQAQLELQRKAQQLAEERAIRAHENASRQEREDALQMQKLATEIERLKIVAGEAGAEPGID